MCGVPYHSVDGYIAKLVQKGYRIAICEQMEDPRFAKGIVERKVIKIITPGTALNEQLLQDKHNRYLVLLLEREEELCMAVADVSTGECRWFLATGGDKMADITEQLYRLQPAELVMIDDLRPGYQMARACGVDFIAAGWSHPYEELRRIMQEHCDYYLKTVAQLEKFLFA